MMRLGQAVGVVTLALLSGCAATQFVAQKADMTAFPRDNFDCRQLSRELWVAPLIAAPLAAYAAQKKAEANYEMCMQARGYQVHRVND